MNQLIFQRSADSIRLRDELVLTPIGQIATYARLSDVLGKKVSGSTSALRSARQLAQRDDGMVFSCVRTEGLKRLDDESIVTLAGVEALGVRRHARRVNGRLALADFSHLREASQRRAIGIASVLAVVADMTRQKSIGLVTGAASGRAAQLPIHDTLVALGLQ